MRLSFHKRKQFWVDAPLQLQMLGYVLVLVGASLLLVSFSILRGLSQASAQTRQIFHSLDWVRETMRGPLVVSSCLSILASGLLTLIWSHRFAGPLRVLSAGMSRLKHGNFSVPTKIRTTDTHQDLIKEFAQMQDHLRGMLQEDRDRLAKAIDQLAAAASQAGGDEGRQIQAVADELKAIGTRYHL
jgi:nitrogen fixation/metabolism regulation signal transduction histidine kinase